jgi:hypothetical protein
VLLVSGVAGAQTPATVFKEIPQLRISEGGLEGPRGVLPRNVAESVRVVIFQIGDEYYWASRENIPLVAIDGGGAYVTYLSVNGHGYGRVVKPEMKSVAGLLSEYDIRRNLPARRGDGRLTRARARERR